MASFFFAVWFFFSFLEFLDVVVFLVIFFGGRGCGLVGCCCCFLFVFFFLEEVLSLLWYTGVRIFWEKSNRRECILFRDFCDSVTTAFR